MTGNLYTSVLLRASWVEQQQQQERDGRDGREDKAEGWVGPHNESRQVTPWGYLSGCQQQSTELAAPATPLVHLCSPPRDPTGGPASQHGLLGVLPPCEPPPSARHLGEVPTHAQIGPP